MEGFNEIVLSENNSNNRNVIRKIHGLDQRDVDKALANLDQWLKSQRHYGKKDFPSPYLEAILIANKGQTEKAKEKIDKLFSIRTEFPEYFGDFDIKKDFIEFDGIMHYAFLPKFTKDLARIFVLRNAGKSFQSNVVSQSVRILIMMLEYLKLNDHNDGCVVVFDLTGLSMLAILKCIKLEDVRISTKILTGVCGMRIKGIHFISPSKLINLIIWLSKQVMPAKLVSRIYAHQSFEGLYSFVDADLLPMDYGGKESSLEVLHERWQQALGSDQFRAFQREMSKAVISEGSSISSTVTSDINSS